MHALFRMQQNRGIRQRGDAVMVFARLESQFKRATRHFAIRITVHAQLE